MLKISAKLPKVPNAPCGVERVSQQNYPVRNFFVPNAPCGVESYAWVKPSILDVGVPNAPCGVESFNRFIVVVGGSSFLMHRVELKALSFFGTPATTSRFLMHRVELKVVLYSLAHLSFSPVPNAPCGVESHTHRIG